MKGVGGFRLTPDVLIKYAGAYQFDSGREAVITLDGPTLILNLSGQPAQTFTLAAEWETMFVSTGFGERAEFAKDENGAITGLFSPPERVWEPATAQPACRGQSGKGLHPGIRTPLGATEFLCYEPPVPGQNGGRLGHAGHLGQMLPAEAPADFSERRSLRIRQPEPSGKLRAYNPIPG